MPKRARFFIFPAFLALVAAAMCACESETGPDAPKRTSGCIDTDCYPTDAGKDATKDAQ